MKSYLLHLFDRNRDRAIDTHIFLPERKERSKILYFSHGAGGSPKNYLYLFKYLTEFNYTVIAPQHPGSDRKKLKELIKKGFDIKEAILYMLEDKDEWVNRPKDISFLIDETLKLKSKWKFLDTDGVGAFGHSYGSYTVNVTAGARIYLNKGSLSLRDERIKAIVSYSPQGDSSFGIPRMFKRDSWREIDVPFLYIAGSDDVGILGQPLSWRMEGFYSASSKERYFVLIKDANHFDFTDKGSCKIHRVVEYITYLFFEIFLKGKIELKENLKGEIIRKNFVKDGLKGILLLKGGEDV